MTTSQQAPAHAEQARDHLTQKIREDVNEYWPTTPSWDKTDHFLAAISTDAAAATGHALLAIHEDLTGLRDDLAEGRIEEARQRGQAWQRTDSIARSLAKLNDSISAAGPVAALVAAEMAALRREVAALDKGLSGIAEAVRDLAAAVNDSKRRRRWPLARRRKAFDSAYDQATSGGDR